MFLDILTTMRRQLLQQLHGLQNLARQHPFWRRTQRRQTHNGDFMAHRIHGAGIYANIGGILMGSMLPYIAAPWILWDNGDFMVKNAVNSRIIVI